HPLDCPVCDQGGKCDLQDFSHEYTPTTSRFTEVKRIFQKEYFSPLIETQMNRCVQCLRCVRYCDEVMDVKALAPVGRGTMTEIKHFGSHELECEFCGGCVQICPVGAITSRLSMYEYRPWMLKRADTVCTFCGDGCQITIQTKNNELIEVNSAQGAGRNNGDLCARGFFGFHATSHPDRLTHPLIRREGHLVQATWEEALEYVADATCRLKLVYGSDAFGGLISSRCTNEDLYVFQKFMRLAIGTTRIDSSARYGHINGVQALRRVQGTHRWTVTFDDIVAADVLLLIGTNITETNPITGLKVKEAVKKRGATLVTIEALEPALGTISNIATLSQHHLAASPSHFGNMVLGLLKAVTEGGHVHPALKQEAPAYVQALKHILKQLPWSEIEATTAVSADEIRRAADAIVKGNRLVILVGPGVLRQTGGNGTLVNLLDLLILTGKLTQSGCGLAPLAEENNDQGAVEMGALSEFLPGPVDVSDRAACDRLTNLWKEDLPKGSGASLIEMLEDGRRGRLKAMFVVGENPVGSLPPSAGAREGLENLDLLVCQELFLTETAALAHVVLPACSYAEKDGTFTNSEGHVQAVRHAIDPIGESRPDWEILSALSVLIGYPLEYAEAREILKEIRSLTPGYGLLGPAPTPPKVHSLILREYLENGYAADLSTRYALSAKIDQSEGSVTLILHQSLFHSGKLSTRSKGLLRLQSEGSLALNPTEMAKHGLSEGDRVRVANGQGEMHTVVKGLDRVPEGVAWFPEHFDEEARRLLTFTCDPCTKVP
ncbi:MAG: molybdopterin-dependent oxidoreductase, partial [Nitrospiraceae bacterium]